MKLKGDVAQMVERSLSMREVQGSTPCFSKYDLFLHLNIDVNGLIAWDFEYKFSLIFLAKIIRLIRLKVTSTKWITLPLQQLANIFVLPGGESNPGLPRDRRGYWPLYYRGPHARFKTPSSTHWIANKDVERTEQDVWTWTTCLTTFIEK